MENTKHIWRVSLLLVFLLVVLVLVRHFLIPKSFGEMGYYRFDALAEIAAHEPVHGPPDACAECHDEVAMAKARGMHSVVQCEVCHAPLATHVEEGDVIAPMTIQRSYELCLYCHMELVARPSSIAQINLNDHLEIEPGQAVPPEACLECHDTDAIHSP
ncbi:MAG: cytochrome C [bacterium]